MDQSKSSNAAAVASGGVVLPKRSFSVEFMVGLFTLAGVAATGYLAIGLGDLKLFGNSSRYNIEAEFDNVSGLQYGASVEIAGVPVGEITDIRLEDSHAIVTLSINKTVRLQDDDIASIRTKGIIGDRYLKISRGGSKTIIPEGGKMTETESVVDIEDIIGKIVHSLGGDKDKSEEEKPAKGSEERGAAEGATK